MIQQEFASPEAALVHFGRKGMKWGVRNERVPSSTVKKHSTGKKVAVGVGAVALTAGSVFVAYKMGKIGNVPVSSLAKQRSKDTAAVADFLSSAGGGAEAQKYAEMFLRSAGR